MSDSTSPSPLQSFETLTQFRLDALMYELTRRVRVVNEDALTHLIDRGVIARMARDGCCKPDGGTCCPNARTGLEQRFDPNARK